MRLPALRLDSRKRCLTAVRMIAPQRYFPRLLAACGSAPLSLATGSARGFGIFARMMVLGDD